MPLPRPNLPLREVRRFGADPLHTPLALHGKYGDAYRIPVATALQPVYVTRVPDEIEQVLVRDRAHYRKGISLQWLDGLFGNSILLSEGETWKRSRKLMAPAFHRKALDAYARVMVEKTDAALANIVSGQRVDTVGWSMTLTLDIVLECLFGRDLGDMATVVGDALDDGLLYADTIIGKPFRLPRWLPLRANRSRRRVVRIFHDLMDEMIQARRASDDTRDDLLGMLLAARDEEGNGLDDRQLRDELITLLLAGHETTALNVAYTLMLLGRHPDTVDAMHDELVRTLDGAEPSMASLAEMPLQTAVWKESLRLYPPVGLISRQALAPMQLGGQTIEQNSQVVIPIWALHHDAQWYPEPFAFRPERWFANADASRPRYAFLPFGGGHRVCIGDQFARIESQLIVARVLQRYRLTTIHPYDPPFKLTITMRPQTPVWVRFDARG